MRFHSTLAVTAFMGLVAFNVNAQNTATVTITPAPGEYDTLPTEFVFTIDGPESIKKNTLGGNPMLITRPDGTSTQVQGTFSGMTITCKVPTSGTNVVPLDQHGTYTIQFRNQCTTYTWADGTTSKSVKEEFVYTIQGKEEEDPDVKKEVQYDIDMIKTIPGLRPFDLGMKDIETLQIYFDGANLQLDPNADAFVTIVGPNFNQTSKLAFNMNMGTATVFKAAFNNPKYNGNYTMTIPQGVIGDAEWIEDHQYGRANKAVVYEFTVEGGDDPSNITTDLTFNPVVTPASGSKVSTLDKVTLTFPTMPYWDAEKEITVTWKEDASATAATAFGKAVVERGAGNELVIVFEPTPTAKAEYFLNLPEQIFWNEDHEADKEGGKLNGELVFNWNLAPVVTSVTVTGHTPATDAKVSAFKAGEPGIVIMTSNNDVVAKMDVEVIEYALGNDSAAPKTIINATSDAIDEEGNICWVNSTGADIELSSSCFYEVNFKLYNTSNNMIADGVFEFYGDMTTGVITVDADKKDVIFNTQGLKINKEVNELPAGLYIINGRKMVVR